MKFLITGGAGFIGSAFTRMLLNGDFNVIPTHVTVVDALTYSGNLKTLMPIEFSPKFRFIKGDICDQEMIATLIRTTDVIINFAAETHVDRSIVNQMPFIRTNVLGTGVLLTEAVKNKKIIFIQVSTDEVYGSIENGSWDENCNLQPNSPYAASKAGSDLLALSYNKTFGLDVRITRCCNNFGPYQFPEKIIPLFVSKLLKGQKVPIYGIGNNFREWIFVEDHCHAIWKTLIHGKSGNVYNIGSNTELSNLDLTKKILYSLKLDESFIEFVPDRLGHDFRYSLNSEKAKRELGFESTSNFDEKLDDTLNWYRDNSIFT